MYLPHCLYTSIHTNNHVGLLMRSKKFYSVLQKTIRLLLFIRVYNENWYVAHHLIYQMKEKLFLEPGANLESRAAHTNPKDTQVPPRGVAVAYRRWAFAINSNFKALTGKILVFWIAGRLWEVVAHGGCTLSNLLYSVEF